MIRIISVPSPVEDVLGYQERIRLVLPQLLAMVTPHPHPEAPLVQWVQAATSLAEQVAVLVSHPLLVQIAVH